MRVLCLIATIASLLAIQDPPQPRPTFKSGVDVVALDVTVLDAKRQPVKGLRAEDFTVLEEGKPQPIVSFQEFNAPDPNPALVPWLREVDPDVRTNGEGERRTIVMILDDALVHFSHVPYVRQIGLSVIDQLGPEDQLCIIYTAVNQKSQEFTSNRQQLRRTVERFSDSASPFMAGPQYSIQTIRRASEALAALPERRKALIFVSTLAVDFANPNDDFGLQLQKAVEAAQESNVAVFPISPAGLEVNIDAPAAPLVGRTLMSASAGSRRDLANDTALYLANETGGLAVINTNAYTDVIQQVFRETGSYYLLGFQSSHRDGRYRRIEVRTVKDGLSVRTRSRYRAPKNERPKRQRAVDPATKALSGILPVGGIPLRLAVAPFATGGEQAALAIVAGVQQTAPATRVEDSISLVVNAFDVGTQAYRLKGKTAYKGKVILRPSADGDAKYELLGRLDLKPGRYQVRIGLESAISHSSGSVFHDLEVPDFRKLPLSLSGLVIAATPAVYSTPKGLLSDLIPVSPTTQRTFTETDQAKAFLRIYQGGRKPALPTVLTTSIVDGEDRQVHYSEETVGIEAFGEKRSRDLAFDLPLARLRPGPYLLRVAARAGEYESRREVRFAVREP